MKDARGMQRRTECILNEEIWIVPVVNRRTLVCTMYTRVYDVRWSVRGIKEHLLECTQNEQTYAEWCMLDEGIT